MPRLVCVAFILVVLRSGFFVHALRRNVSLASAVMQNTGAASMHRSNDSFVILPNEETTKKPPRAHDTARDVSLAAASMQNVGAASMHPKDGFVIMPNKETKEKKTPAHVTAVQLIELFKTEKVFNDQTKFLTTVANDLLTQQPLEKPILKYLKNNPQRFINASNEWQSYKKWLSNIIKINEGSDLILKQVFGYTREPGNDTQGNEGTNFFKSYWLNEVLENTEMTELLKQNKWQNELTEILKQNKWKDAIGASEALANAIEKYEPYYCAYLADYVDFRGFFESRLPLKQLKAVEQWKLAIEENMRTDLDMSVWMRPVQRLPRYELIVKEINKDKIVPKGVRDAAVAAHNKIKRVSFHVNGCQLRHGMMNHAREQWELGRLSREHKKARTNREKPGDKTKVNISENCHRYVKAHNVVVLSQDPTSKGRKWKARTLHICTNALFIAKAKGPFKPSPQIIRLNEVESIEEVKCPEKVDRVTEVNLPEDGRKQFSITAKSETGAGTVETVIRGAQNLDLKAIKKNFEEVRRLWRAGAKKALLKVNTAKAFANSNS